MPSAAMDAPRDWSVPAPCYQQPLDSTFPVNCIVELRHPGLADSRSNLLFRFPAYDRRHGGVHHSVALTACAIVAGNKWTGYLSETAGSPPAVQGLGEGADPVLTGKRYYFHPHPYIAGKSPISLGSSGLTCGLLQQTPHPQPRPPRAAQHHLTLSTRLFRTGDSLTTTFRPGGLKSRKVKLS